MQEAFDYIGRKEDDPDKIEDKFVVVEDGVASMQWPIKYNLRKPLIDKNIKDGPGRDQTFDAAANMRYAATLKLPELGIKQNPRMGRAIIVGGGPSIKSELENIKKFAAAPDNLVFALNASHTWLIQNGVIPHGCALFEIDAEPDVILKAGHPDVTYYICSHCHKKTFDELANHKRVLWHPPPGSPIEKEVAKELFPDQPNVGGGIGTFLRTISITMMLGFRNMELFGCDSSFPEDSSSTHVAGYETANDVKTDAFYVYAKQRGTTQARRFRTVGYLALQADEFKEYCRINHTWYALRVHGDTLLRYVHERMYPDQYSS